MDFTFHPGTNGTDPWVEFYPYAPSKTAGYAFMALFGITTVAHFVVMFPYRAAYFIPLVLGGICKSQVELLAKSMPCLDGQLTTWAIKQAKPLATTDAPGRMKIEQKSAPGRCRKCSSCVRLRSSQPPSTCSWAGLCDLSTPNTTPACALNGSPRSL